MSEEGENELSDGQEEAPSMFDQKEGVDWFLAWLVGYAENFALEQGVTLFIGGQIVSGLITSGRDFFTEVGNQVKDGADSGEATAELRKSIGEGYAEFSKLYPKAEIGVPPPFSKPTYIHLRNVAILTPNGSTPLPRSTIWRGKLASVDGYNFGVLSTEA